jgi:hypothetical protein
MTTCYTSLCLLQVASLGTFYLWVGNPWFGTCLRSGFYDYLNYLGGLAITGLTLLFP